MEIASFQLNTARCFANTHTHTHTHTHTTHWNYHLLKQNTTPSCLLCTRCTFTSLQWNRLPCQNSESFVIETGVKVSGPYYEDILQSNTCLDCRISS